MRPAASSLDVAAGPVPARAGIGLRAPHYRELIERHPDIGWVEVHSENFFGAGGQPHWFVESVQWLSVEPAWWRTRRFRDPRPRASDPAQSAARLEPRLVSEHLSWSSVSVAISTICFRFRTRRKRRSLRSVIETQDFLRRRIHQNLELRCFPPLDVGLEFLRAAAERTGCGILLDVNNVYVSVVNHGFDPPYLASIPSATWVRSIYGFEQASRLIDTTAHVLPTPWALYEWTVQRLGRVPTLIEWDTNIPALDVLLAEARTADTILETRDAVAA
jgi:uncharacterized protein (UPF0276 family)